MKLDIKNLRNDDLDELLYEEYIEEDDLELYDYKKENRK